MLTTEALVEVEAAALGLGPPADAPRPGPLTLPAALRTGGVVAAVTASMPLARLLRDAVTAGVTVPEERVRAYYDRNLDRYTRPEVRHVSRLDGPRAPRADRTGCPAVRSVNRTDDPEGRVGDAPLGAVRRGELAGPLGEAIFSAREGETAGPVEGPGGRWTVRVDRIDPGRRRPYEEVRDGIAAELASVAVDRAFAAWLERRYAERVRLHHGYEHPADPHHADATHRH